MLEFSLLNIFIGVYNSALAVFLRVFQHRTKKTVFLTVKQRSFTMSPHLCRSFFSPENKGLGLNYLAGPVQVYYVLSE